MKTYSKQTNGTQHSIPIRHKGKNVFITFVKNYWREALAYFTTSDNELQASIEASNYFTSEEVKLVQTPEEQLIAEEKAAKLAAELVEAVDTEKVVEELEDIVDTEKVVEETANQITTFAEIDTFQEAKKILTAEPYNITRQSLTTPERILKKAAEVGVSFPKLEIK